MLVKTAAKIEDSSRDQEVFSKIETATARPAKPKGDESQLQDELATKKMKLIERIAPEGSQRLRAGQRRLGTMMTFREIMR